MDKRTKHRGDRARATKLNEAQAHDIRLLRSLGDFSLTDLAKMFGVSAATIYNILKRASRLGDTQEATDG